MAARASQREAIERLEFGLAYEYAKAAREFAGVDVTDPVEAATACQECRSAHCPALSGPPTGPVEPREPPAAPPPWSPDATGDEG